MSSIAAAQTEKKKFGISASGLKYIVIFAMLCDHIAYLFLPSESMLYGVMRCFGRTTAPVMCFFISEGFHYTHNLKKYFLRLGVFAFISHFAFRYAFGKGIFSIGVESFIATLFFSLLSVYIYNTEKVKTAFKFPLIILMLFFADFCDWGADAVLFTLAFELARGKRENQLIAYGSVAIIRRLFPLFRIAVKTPDAMQYEWYKFGVLIPIVLIMLYNGEKGGSKHTKWVFYIFYPAHLFVLGYIHRKYFQ
ncbi:MAG: hypothetical protein J6Y71_01270 [Ruminococcus sp.]|nr:hypothetical protein [Ruminococcus sp.]